MLSVPRRLLTGVDVLTPTPSALSSAPYGRAGTCPELVRRGPRRRPARSRPSLGPRSWPRRSRPRRAL